MLDWINAYEEILAAGLWLAILLNATQIRALALSFIALSFLVIAPRLINLSPNTEWQFFPIAIALEGCFGITAILTKAKAAKYMAALCAYCAAAHVIGWISYINASPVYESYKFVLRVGEISQLIALILSSGPITKLVLYQHLKCIEKDKDNGHRMVTSRG